MMAIQVISNDLYMLM